MEHMHTCDKFASAWSWMGTSSPLGHALCVAAIHTVLCLFFCFFVTFRSQQVYITAGFVSSPYYITYYITCIPMVGLSTPSTLFVAK